MAVLVRNAELACRTSWRSDLWEPRPEDFCVDVKLWGPFPAETPLDDLPADLLGLLLGTSETR